MNKNDSTGKKYCNGKENENTNKRPSKGRKQRNGSKQPFDADKATEPVKNNASMYYTSPVLADQVSNFSFNSFLGVNENPAAFGYINPGIVMSIYCNPSPGFTDGSATAGINIAAMKAYTYLSANNAKTTNYAPQDVSTLILAIGEVLSAVTVAKRAIKIAYTYNMRNRAFPLQIIRSMGFDPSFVTTGEIAKVRMALNTVINKFNQVPIMLDNITYLTKCIEMYENIYQDSEGPMVQYYVNVPYSTWMLDEDSYDQGSILKTVEFPNSAGVAAQWDRDMMKFIETIDIMINALLGSTTLNYIYSDILRVAGSGGVKLYKLDLLREDEVILPVYNPMKLIQIHNSYAMGKPNGTAYEPGIGTPANDVYPDVNKNGLVYLPSANATFHSDKNEVILDFPHSMGNPDVDQRVDATRYISMRDVDASNHTVLKSSTVPDHYIVSYDIWKANADGTLTIERSSTNNLMSNITKAQAVDFASVISTFDYAPFFYIGREDGIPQTYSRLGDLDFFTTIGIDYLKRVNELALQGIFELRV